MHHAVNQYPAKHLATHVLHSSQLKTQIFLIMRAQLQGTRHWATSMLNLNLWTTCHVLFLL
uniref:Uncharacterized protein n=1 Tax=Arundo donax TaxID=35708 RepID=A0A0A9AHW4_ARUDO